MTHAEVMSSGLRINTSNGPKTGTFRTRRNSSAAFRCASSYLSGGRGGSLSSDAVAKGSPENAIAPTAIRTFFMSFIFFSEVMRAGRPSAKALPSYVTNLGNEAEMAVLAEYGQAVLEG